MRTPRQLVRMAMQDLVIAGTVRVVKGSELERRVAEHAKRTRSDEPAWPTFVDACRKEGCTLVGAAVDESSLETFVNLPPYVNAICTICGEDRWTEEGEWVGEKPGKGGVISYSGFGECNICGNVQKIAKPHESTGN
jgi:hypothetical protein